MENITYFFQFNPALIAETQLKETGYFFRWEKRGDPLFFIQILSGGT